VHQSHMRSKLLTAVGAAIMLVALFAPTAQAREPAEGYEQFAGCPSPEEVPVATSCFRAVIGSGHFIMGNKEVPIENPIELSGGLTKSGEGAGASPSGGLTPVPQKVPGGVVGLTGLTWLLEFFGSEALTLYATAELAGLPSSPLKDPVSLPLRVHLTNPGGLIGSTCYIGSFTEPISLKLTVGTTEPPPPNEPISGTPPTFKGDPVTKILHLENGTYVDNAFAAPGVNGCKLYLFGFIPISINGLVDETAGLPSPAGTNETVQNFNAEVVASRFVYPPEE
jgi:hypothetical protein